MLLVRAVVGVTLVAVIACNGTNGGGGNGPDPNPPAGSNPCSSISTTAATAPSDDT